MFHIWAALRAASVRSTGLLYSKDAVWAPKEARQRILDCSVQNLQSYVEGAPINVVNRPR